MSDSNSCAFCSECPCVCAQNIDRLVRIAEKFAYDLPYTIDEATVPKAGIDSNPDQVVGEISCAVPRMRELRAALEPFRT
jgi:hypothetical protein